MSGYVLDDQVGYLLRLASQRHAVLFAAHAPQGLTPTQFSALVRIAEDGPVSQNQLGRRAAMDVATIKGVVDRLRQKGLVRLGRDAGDRRRTLISLSPQGAAMMADLHRAGQEITAQTLAPLDPGEQEALVRLLRKLG